MRGEHVILCGDLNKHVGDLVKDNHSKVSVGGNLIRNFLANKSYTLLNASDKTLGGPFTRYNPACPKDDTAKSCLDLCIVSNDLFRYVEKVTIDKHLNFTPGRSLGKGNFCYSDHYALLIEIKNIPLASSQVSKKKRKIWNLNKEEGWKDFRILTEVNENLASIEVNKEEDSTAMMKKFDEEVNKVKFKSFG